MSGMWLCPRNDMFLNDFFYFKRILFLIYCYTIVNGVFKKRMR